MKRKLIYLVLPLCLVQLSLHAQRSERSIAPLDSADRMLALAVNPIFAYVGNMFNQSESNSFSLSGASLIYRKMNTPNRAFRLRGGFEIFRSADAFFTGQLEPNRLASTSAMVSIGLGSEWRVQRKRWSVYGGAEFLMRHQSDWSSYSYADSITVLLVPFRPVSSVAHQTGLGFGLFVGAEYFLGDVFFIGAEVNAPFLFTFVHGRKEVREVLFFSDEDGLPFSFERTEELPTTFDVYVNSAEVVVFRIGVRF